MRASIASPLGGPCSDRRIGAHAIIGIEVPADVLVGNRQLRVGLLKDSGPKCPAPDRDALSERDALRFPGREGDHRIPRAMRSRSNAVGRAGDARAAA
jgi:hypothetical protein